MFSNGGKLPPSPLCATLTSIVIVEAEYPHNNISHTLDKHIVCVDLLVLWPVSQMHSSVFSICRDVAQRCYCGSSNCRGYLGQSKQATPFRAATMRSLRDIGSPREGGWRRRTALRAESQEDSMVSSILEEFT